MNIISETIRYIEIGETWGTSKGMLIPIILFTIISIGAVCFGVQGLIHEPNISGMIVPGILILMAIVLGISFWHSKPIYKEVPEYTITINDTITAKEFFNTYELQSIDGDTYIVRDKGWWENN